MIEAIRDSYKIDYDTFNITLPLLDMKGWDILMMRLGVNDGADLFHRTIYPRVREFVTHYQFASGDDRSLASLCSKDGPEGKYLAMLNDMLQEKELGYDHADSKLQGPLVVLFFYEPGAGSMDSLIHYYRGFDKQCIQFVVPKQYQESDEIAKFESIGYTFLRSSKETQHPVINEALDMIRNTYGSDTLVSVNDLDHLLVWRSSDDLFYQYTSYEDMAMLYLYEFLSTDGCVNKNVNERFVSPCTCMLEKNEKYVSNKEAVFSEHGVQNVFHPTMNFYLPSSSHKMNTERTVFYNLHPPLNAVAHHTMGGYFTTTQATHATVLHLRRDDAFASMIKYTTFLVGPERNGMTNRNATVDLAIKCAVGDPNKFIKKERKSECHQVKEISNIISIIHQRKLCLEASYSEKHCENDLACCLTSSE